MSFTTIIGIVAGTMTTASFLPQVIKTWKTKSARDLSLGMYLIFCIGVTLWLIYGIIKMDIPIIASNVVTLTLAVMLLIMKLSYR